MNIPPVESSSRSNLHRSNPKMNNLNTNTSPEETSLGRNTSKTCAVDNSRTAGQCRRIGHYQELTRFCDEHQERICEKCERLHHRDCTVLAVADKLRALLEEMDAISGQVSTHEKDVMREFSRMQEVLDTSTQDFTKMREEVRGHADKICRRVREQERELLAEISTAERELERTVQEQLARIKASMQDAEQAKVKLEDAGMEADTWSCLQKLHSIKSWWEREGALTMPSLVHWECSIQSRCLTQEEYRMGNLDVDKVFNTRRRKSLRDMLRNKGASSSRVTRNRQMVLTGRQIVVGITSVHGWILVLHRGDPHIWVYRKDGRMEKMVSVPNVKCLNGCGIIAKIPCTRDSPLPQGEGSLPVGEASRVCLVDWGGRAMHLLTLSMDLEIMHQEIISLRYTPYSVTTSQNDIVLTDYVDCLVNTYDHQGRELYHHTAPQQEGTIAGCAIKLPSGVYVTREFGSGNLVFSDSSGHKLPPSDHLHHQLKYPLGLTRDAAGNILVACEHSVSLLDSQGTFIRYIIKDGGVRHPYSIHLCDDGWLYVADNKADGRRELKVLPYSEHVPHPDSDEHAKHTSILATLTLYE